jgi:hypothetical protein
MPVRVLLNPAILEDDGTHQIKFTCDNPVFPSMSAGEVIKYFVVFEDLGDDALSPILAIGVLDQSTATGQGTLTIDLSQSPLAINTGAPPSAVKEVRRELLKLNNDAGGRPLPVALHPTSSIAGTTHPNDLLDSLEAGNHALPCFMFPTPGESVATVQAYAEVALGRLKAYRLPLYLSSTQWESRLYYDAAIKNSALDINPNVVTPADAVLDEISFYGDLSHWQTVGDSMLLGIIQRSTARPAIFISGATTKPMPWGRSRFRATSAGWPSTVIPPCSPSSKSAIFSYPDS